MTHSATTKPFWRLKHEAHWSAYLAFFLLWIAASLVLARIFGFSIGNAIGTGLLIVLLHHAGEWVHQAGHAFAANRTGYPMLGIRWAWGLGLSIYPDNEPDLPARTHIRRALGGVPASILATIAFWLLSQFAAGHSEGLYLAFQFAFFENLGLYTLGALSPFGFTDGATLRRYWPQR
jgi:hypothetical protein